MIDLKELKKRPVLKGRAGQNRCTEEEKRELGRMIVDGKYTAEALSAKTRVGAATLRRWAEMARLNGVFATTFEKHADKVTELVVKEKPVQHVPLPPGQWEVGDMNTRPIHTSELNGNVQGPDYSLSCSELEIRLTPAQVQEAVIAWVKSRGIAVEYKP